MPKWLLATITVMFIAGTLTAGITGDSWYLLAAIPTMVLAFHDAIVTVRLLRKGQNKC